jgi:hypothetical protein
LRKIDLFHQLRLLLAALVFAGSLAPHAWGDDLFAIAPSIHDNLVIFGPKGDRVAELSVPTISQAVTVGGTSFQISYGRDANNLLTAILAPSSSQPQNLHFTVLNKTIDADKNAVVTLTFPSSNHVIVDPGYVGVVAVNSQTLHHHSLADEVPPPAPPPMRVSAPQVVTATHTTTTTTSSSANNGFLGMPPLNSQESTSSSVSESSTLAPNPIIPPITHESAPVNSQLTTVPSNPPVSPKPPIPSQESMATVNPQSPVQTMAPTTMVPPPLLGSLTGQPPIKVPGSASSPDVSGNVPTSRSPSRLYWAEPITPPEGNPPSVAIDEMKLVAVHGPVTLKLPNGDTKSGVDGMIVPSGTSITTADNASAAVFIGGVDSARFTSNTEAKVTENLDDSGRHTNIKLRMGSVFNRVGHRPGEKQDYEVHTPEAIAAARGTNYAVSVVNSGGQEVTICATKDGVVTLTDLADGHKITITPLSGNQVAVGSVPQLPIALLQSVLLAFLNDLQQFDVTIMAIAAMNPRDRTPAEEAYYEANKGFDSYTKMYDVNTGAIVPLFVTTADRDLYIDQINDIDYVVPPARRANNQMLRPYGTQPLSPF